MSYDPQRPTVRSRGLYRPEFEHDSCGVGFVAHIKGAAQPPDRARRGSPLLPHGSSRRARRGTEHRRRRGHSDRAAARVFRQVREARVRRRAAGPGAVRGRQRVPAARDPAEREHCKSVVAEDLRRGRPDAASAGARCRPSPKERISGRPRARGRCRTIEQLFIAAGDRHRRRCVRAQAVPDPQAREPPVAQRSVARASEATSTSAVCRARSSIYKGMLTPGQLMAVLPGPRRSATTRRTSRWCTRGSRRTRSRAGTVRSRTASCRHNGEINTLRGNENWMRAREGVVQSGLVRRRRSRSCSPIVEPDCSDSGIVRQRARVPAR